MSEFEELMTDFQWEDKQSYAKWCAHTYYYVCHSTRLLAHGAARASLSTPSLHRRFVDHLSEEKGHEKLVLNDLKKLGFSISQFREMPETALFYQNQYYWLNYHGAVPFLGWILALEGAAVRTCGAAHARVIKAHGASAGVFLKLHSEEDIEHLEKAMDAIKDLSGDSLALISQNFEQSCELYFSVLKRIKSEASNLRVAS